MGRSSPDRAPCQQQRSNPATASSTSTSLQHVDLLWGISVKHVAILHDRFTDGKRYLDFEWLGEPGLLDEAAKIDAQQRNIAVDEYLANVSYALRTFLKSGQVHDRADFYDVPIGLIVILVSSESMVTLTSSLGKTRYNPQFNLNDLTYVLFAGEIPSKSMWDLLVTKQKSDTNETVFAMGENLATLLIASYGGHFFIDYLWLSRM